MYSRFFERFTPTTLKKVLIFRRTVNLLKNRLFKLKTHKNIPNCLKSYARQYMFASRLFYYSNTFKDHYLKRTVKFFYQGFYYLFFFHLNQLYFIVTNHRHFRPIVVQMVFSPVSFDRRQLVSLHIFLILFSYLEYSDSIDIREIFRGIFCF